MSLRLSGGRRLQSPPGSTARPTPSRVRLAVMNMLGADLPGASWLDLCCGSGVMGCEALQHGARRVVAVDQDRRMAATARANLELVAGSRTPAAEVKVVQQEVERWLSRGAAAAGEDGFDLIYADPPYAAGLYAGLAAAVARGGWLRPHGRLLLECGSNALPEPPQGWSLQRQRRYGSSTVLVLSQLAETAADRTGRDPDPAGAIGTAEDEPAG
ncbi:MAG: rRNA ((966)-N(2))-methyltransferase RsmD [Cyanobacteriota bacterium]